MEPNPKKEEPPQLNQAGSEKPKKPMFAVSDLMQDGRNIFIMFNGKQLVFDRATPMGVAYNKLQSEGIREYWRIALDKGPQDGKKMPSETANIVETPKRRSWLSRFFGFKSDEPVKTEAPRKKLIPGIPDYAGAAEALGIQASAVVQAVAVLETGTTVTMTDGTPITADPKSELARSVAVLLEEFDAIGHNHAKAREAINRPLGRPIVRMRQFGNTQAKTPEKKSRASKPKDEGLVDPIVSISEEEPSVYLPADADSLPRDFESNAWENSQKKSVATEVRRLIPIERSLPNKVGEKKPKINSGEIKTTTPPPPQAPEALSQLVEEIKNPPIISQVSNLTPAEQTPEGTSDTSANANASGGEEVVYAEENVGGEPYPENSASIEEPAIIAAESEAPLFTQTAERNDEFNGYVMVGQRARPKPEGPFTLEARTQEKVDGKYKSITQFNVSKKDYAVVAWLAQKKIKSTYKISLVPPDESNPEQVIPEGVIEDVQVKNEAGFVSLSWKQLREEFEKANNLSHRPEFQDALKSAEIESASTTTMLPGVRQPAPPREQDIGGGGGLRPLPKLRPVIVPKALEDPGHSF